MGTRRHGEQRLNTLLHTLRVYALFNCVRLAENEQMKVMLVDLL
jgi:hypothetical protein